MDSQAQNLNGNVKRALWRGKCRKRLAKHIFESLGIKVKPSEVRLKTSEDENLYTWEIDDVSLRPLFDKHLSKHSVGAYMELCQQVGISFRAVHREKVYAVSPASVSLSELQSENLNLTERLMAAEDRISGYIEAISEAEAEIQNQKSILMEAQMTIHLQQQEIQQWMAISESFQLRCLRGSDYLVHLIGFLQGTCSDHSTALSSE